MEAPEEIERRLVGEEDLELARLFLDVASHGKSKEPSTLMRPELKAFVAGLSFAQRKGAQKRVNERVAAMGVKDLKSALTRLNIKFAGIVEKGDLRQMLATARVASTIAAQDRK